MNIKGYGGSGYFGKYGGCFVPELLIPPLRELSAACARFLPDEGFKDELNRLLTSYAGRQTPLTFCPALSQELGFELWLKREDLLHTGAHKMNNTLGQALLAKKMGKQRLIAETGAGQHGVATAAAAARLGLECTVYMGAIDVKRQAANVARMKILGTEVVPVDSGSKTLKDAINAALRIWISEQASTHYCFGTAAGPHPFPTLVRDLQRIIGDETIMQCAEMFAAMPDIVVACVGGGSNAIGMFYPFVENEKASQVRLVGVEAGGSGQAGCYNSAPINYGRPGVLHGQYSMLLQNADGQIEPSHSISAGLDYPGVGPEHSFLHQTGRVEYNVITDGSALNAFKMLSRNEGIIPALESAHALAWVLDNHENIAPGGRVVVNLSGRGDKDIDIVREYMPELENV